MVAPVKKRASDSDSTKQSEKASEGAEQTVTIQYKYSMGTYDSTAETILLPCGHSTYSTAQAQWRC